MLLSRLRSESEHARKVGSASLLNLGFACQMSTKRRRGRWSILHTRSVPYSNATRNNVDVSVNVL